MDDDRKIYHDAALGVYMVIQPDSDGEESPYPWGGEKLFEGSLADCESYIRLTNAGYMQ